MFIVSVRVPPSDGVLPSGTFMLFSCFEGEAPLLTNTNYNHVLLAMSRYYRALFTSRVRQRNFTDSIHRTGVHV